MARYWAWGFMIVGGASVAGCHVISPEHLKGERPEVVAKPAEDKPKEAEPKEAEPKEAEPKEAEPKDTVPKVTAKPVSRTAKETETANPAEIDDPLGLAADAMAAGNDVVAAKQLTRHLKAHPDQLVFRNQLAEILFKLERFPEAQYHFGKFDELATGASKSLLGQRIHCHTRLMEIAQIRDDSFAEKLHRGIGLYLIGCEVQSKAEVPGELSADAEKLWCRAANELNEARKLREGDARSAWYTYLVWNRLDQPRPAEKALKIAEVNSVFLPLPTGEDREMRSVLNAVSTRSQSAMRNLPGATSQ